MHSLSSFLLLLGVGQNSGRTIDEDFLSLVYAGHKGFTFAATLYSFNVLVVRVHVDSLFTFFCKKKNQMNTSTFAVLFYSSMNIIKII